MKKIILITLLFILSGCITPKYKVPKPVIEVKPAEVREQLEDMNNKVKAGAIKIEKLSQNSETKLETVKEQIKEAEEKFGKSEKFDKATKNTEIAIKNSKTITEEAKRLKEITLQNFELQTKLANIQGYIEQLKENNLLLQKLNDKQNKEYLEKINKLETENKDLKHKIDKNVKERADMVWYGMMILSGLFIVGGVVSFIYIDKRGGLAVLIGFILAAVAQFMIQYSTIAAIIGGLVFVIGCGFFVYLFYIKSNALKETIISFEHAKKNDWNDQTKSTIKDVQSFNTVRLVNEIKHKERIGQ